MIPLLGIIIFVVPFPHPPQQPNISYISVKLFNIRIDFHKKALSNRGHVTTVTMHQLFIVSMIRDRLSAMLLEFAKRNLFRYKSDMFIHHTKFSLLHSDSLLIIY